MRPTVPLALLAGLLAGCGAEPADIRIDPTVQVHDQRFTDLGAVVVDEQGEPVDDAPARAVAVSDPDVLALSDEGMVQCRQWGDATVTLRADGVEQDVVVRCVLVRELRVQPRAMGFTLTEGAAAGQSEPIVVDVVGPTGEVVEQARVTISSSDPSVARVEGRTVQALRRGAAEIKVVAGDKVEIIPVEITEGVVDREGWPVPDGDTRSIDLGPGRYRVVVQSDQPVEIDVEGGSCEGSGKEVSHDLTCTLEEPGALEIDNPAVLGIGGGTAHVDIRVLQLP